MKRRKKKGGIWYEPKSYQLASIKFGLDRPEAGFFLAPGLGKTSITLMIFRILRKLGLIDELLVLAKRRICYEVWPEEIHKWRQTRKFKHVIVHGKDKQAKLLEEADIRILNYEGLLMLAERRGRKWQLSDLGKEFFLKRKKRVMLVVDESSKLRHTTTQRFKALKQCLRYFKRRYILTGSPAPNGLLNLFGQVFTLDLGATLGTYITQYRNEYFMPSGYMGKDWKLMPGADKRIFNKLRPLILRYGNDQLNLPPLTFVDRYVSMPKAARRAYEEMEQEYLISLEEGDIIAANAAVATGKCRQIANGGVYYTKSGDFTSDPKKARGVKEMHDEKCAELVELLDELEGEPALVTFEFGHDVTRLKKYLKRNAPQYADAPFVGGKMKDAEFAKYKKQWDRGELPVMFGNPESIAHGLNLQGKGGIVIFFALTWNLENYEQFIQRVWRQGQKRRVIVYRIIVRDTVDVDMIHALRTKDRTQQALLRAMGKRHGIEIEYRRAA